MGLDISYYRKLTLLPDVSTDSDGEVPDYNTQWTPGASMVWSEGEWPGRGAPLDPNAVYSFAEKGGFRAGSYGGYGAWRRQLAGYSDGVDFMELVIFADNEGVIGPVVAAKLAGDFAKNEARIEAATAGDDGWFMARYREWRAAFEAAADDGAVDFH